MRLLPTRFSALLILPAATALLSGCARPESPPVATTVSPDGKLQTIRIEVQHGYEPSTILARPNIPIELEFYRNEETGSCAKELEIPSENIKVTLPNHESHRITLPATASGEIPFRCSMDMMRGRIVIQADPPAKG
jgi:plastocyanin domain-containing protein